MSRGERQGGEGKEREKHEENQTVLQGEERERRTWENL